MKHNGKKFISVLLAALLFAGCTAGTPSETGENVGTETETDTVQNGDTFTVGEGEAYAALSDALAVVRGRRQDGDDIPLTIRLKPGTYCLDETVELDETFSNLTIEATVEGRARILGSYRVTGFEWDEFNGVKCLSAPVANEDFTDFYVNDARADHTRYPAEGTLIPAAVESPDANWGNKANGFVVGDGDLPEEMRNLERVTVNFCHAWIDEHSPIASYDRETGALTLLYPSEQNIKADMPYWLENVAEAFGRPNDWYVENGRVYYVPRDESITPETIEAYAPTTGKIFDIHGTEEKKISGVTLRGLELGMTKGDYYNGYSASDGQSVSGADGTVSFRYADDCVMEDCRVVNYGLYGLNLDFGSRNIRVSGCDFLYGGAGGVKIDGSSDENGPGATDHNTIEDCTILHGGRRHMAGCGILMKTTGNNTIAHNEIGDLYYSGISCGWCWGYTDSPSHDNIITKNHIHDIGQGVLSDMGGVYLLGPQPGTVVSNNVIHDVVCADYGAWALYTDEGSSYITLENNICYRTSRNGFEQHYGMENTVRNNIFALTDEALLKVSLFEEHPSVSFDHNILYSGGATLFDLQRNHLSHKTVKSTNNLIWSAAGEEPIAVDLGNGTQWSIEQVNKFFGLEEGSVFADPGFADPENGDFTMPDDSPAYALGFQPIDVSDVGPRK